MGKSFNVDVSFRWNSSWNSDFWKGNLPFCSNCHDSFAASVICDLLMYWFTVVWKYSCNLIKKYPYKEMCKHICIDAIRFTFLSYDMQEYIFVHPEESYSRETYSSGFFVFHPLVARKWACPWRLCASSHGANHRSVFNGIRFTLAKTWCP